MGAHCRSFCLSREPAFQQDPRRDHIDVAVRGAAALEARGSGLAQLGFGLARAQALIDQCDRLAITRLQLGRECACGGG